MCKGTLRQVLIKLYRLVMLAMLVFLTQLCELLPLEMKTEFGSKKVPGIDLERVHCFAEESAHSEAFRVCGRTNSEARNGMEFHEKNEVLWNSLNTEQNDL
jgi:hypothetical protein